MRRLDERRMLDVLVKKGDATPAMMHAVAHRVAQFHASAEGRLGWRYGSAAAVWHRVIGDLASYESFIGYTVGAADLEQIEAYCRGFIEAHWNLINRRAASGRVRECHGDLRADQICMEREITIFDCVEFSEQLRYGDVASEVGFLAMDLDRLGAPRLAQEFVSSYVEISRDDALATMLPFYKCYRASIRAMVASTQSLEAEVRARDREAAKATAQAQFALAHRYAALSRPALVVICGLSGTGKSTVARRLRERIGFEIVSSDLVRKRIAAIPAASRSQGGYDEGIYASEFNRRTYAAMLEEAGAALEAGRGVILDATFRDAATRRLALDCAAAHRAPIALVECRCDENEILRRLDERMRRNNDPSEATPEVYLRQRREFSALDEIPARLRLVVDTRADPITCALAIEASMVEKLPGRE